MDPQSLATLLHERVHAFNDRESVEHSTADSALRKALVLEALRRMAVYPESQRSRRVLLQNLKELALEHRYASCRAGMIYEGFDFSSGYDDAPVSHLATRVYRSADWVQQRKTGVSHARVESARWRLGKILCTCEPLQRKLQRVWRPARAHQTEYREQPRLHRTAPHASDRL